MVPSNRSRGGRPFPPAFITGALFTHDNHTTQTANFWGKLGWANQHEAPTQGTNETKPRQTQGEQIQRQSRKTKTKPDGPKPTPLANQYYGQTKPPQKGRPRPTPYANQRQGQTKQLRTRNFHIQGATRGKTKAHPIIWPIQGKLASAAGTAVHTRGRFLHGRKGFGWLWLGLLCGISLWSFRVAEVSFVRNVGSCLVLFFGPARLVLACVCLFCVCGSFVCSLLPRLSIDSRNSTKKSEVRAVSLPCLNIVPRIPAVKSGRSAL